DLLARDGTGTFRVSVQPAVLRSAHRAVPTVRATRALWHVGQGQERLAQLAVHVLIRLAIGVRMKRMQRMRTKVVALAIVAALVFVACGDNKKKSSKKASTGTKASAVKTDFGATGAKIRVGLLADLSGPFSTLVKDITLAQQVYFDRLNKAGGIAGRQIELVIEDTKYDGPTHKQKFAAMAAKDASGVVMISQSTGSPHTAGIAKDLEADSLIAIPLSWSS